MSSRWGWYGYDVAPRRKAEHGIKAKSQRGSIGETWWSKRFVEVLHSFNMGARLSRGCSYARSGQVMDLDIQPGVVKAKVQGSRATPYKVEIRVPVFSKAEWAEAEEAMGSQAIFLAQLLAGEMPKDIESAFQHAKLSLFPSGIRELKTECSCPDYANPCKHIAATYYILAEAFDEDPFLIFQWRGRSREDLQEHLARFRETEATEAMSEAAPVAMEPLDSATFWRAGEIHKALPTPDPRCDLLLRQLGPSPVRLMGKDFAELLEELLRAASMEARTLLES
jgi:uncharacterized Zn finger protein